jgi:Dolichyl-phosphate-mannose-protein mannosyltransferase
MNASGQATDGDAPLRWTRADTCWLVAISLVALTLRLGYSLQYAGHPLGRLPWVDEGAYWSRGLEILQGHWLPLKPFYQDPLFPYLLALMMKVAGTEVATLRVVLACLGAVTPVVVFLAGRRGLGRAEGVVAAWIAAIYGPLIFTDGLLEKEGPAALVASLALLASASASSMTNRPRLTRMGLAGWTWGLLALLRANAMLLGPLGTVWAGWCQRGRRVVMALAFSVGFVLAILPSTFINACVGRTPELILTTYQMGANFYIGNGPGATGTYWAPDFVEANPAREADDFEAEAWRRSGRPLSPARVSQFWFDQGLARWREAPGDSLRLLITKLGLLMHDFEVPDNQDIEFVRVVASPRLAWGFLGFGWLAPCAVLGLARSHRSAFWWLLTSSTILGLFSTAAFFVVGRYRIPWVPGLALLAGAGLVDVARLAKGRQWAGMAWRVVLLSLPVTALACRPISDPTPDRWGHALIELAMAELGESHLEPAIDAFDEARALGPGPAFRIGELTASGPVHDRLAILIRERLGSDKGERDVPRLQKARWLRQLPEGRIEGRKLLDAVLLDNPGDRQSLRESAAWSLGDPDPIEGRRRAAEQLGAACRAPGADTEAYLLLGLMEGHLDRLPGPDSLIDSQLTPRLALARAILGWRASKNHQVP